MEEEVTPVVENAPKPEGKPEKESKWYVLRVVSGKERKVKEYLDKDIARNGWTNTVKQVFLPVEKVYKVANGKKVMRERNFYPGYIMIEVAGSLHDDMIQHLSNISNVMHFLTDGKGSKGNIISLRKAEVNKMLGRVDEMSDASGVTMSEPFIIGETIKIIDGPFNDFNGVIEEVNDEKKKIKVQVKIFGRATPVELSYMQVEKIN
jgi:transcription termination/antitermination protein NusG